MNIVVLPEPVGDDTPIRVRPDCSASRHAVMAVSWYGRSTTCDIGDSDSEMPVESVDSTWISGRSSWIAALDCHRLGVVIIPKVGVRRGAGTHAGRTAAATGAATLASHNFWASRSMSRSLVADVSKIDVWIDG